MADRAEMSTSFGRQAATYEAGRPDYPAEAVAWMLEPVADSRLRVADVGAGTGKLTRVLVELGAQAVAVDPDPEMLGMLRASVAGIPTFVGSAEHLPLPDGAVDAVVLGQAWHWVDPAAASVEVARVLRPGGVLGLIWNTRDDDVPWVARLTAIMHGSHAEQMIADGGPVLAHPFGAAQHRRWTWTRSMSRDTLLAMARSRSYLITADPDDRARIEAELEELFDEIGAVGEALVDLPYRTDAYRVGIEA